VPRRPAPEPRPAPSRARQDAATVKTNSTHDLWAGFLSVLGQKASALGDIFVRRGRLLRLDQSDVRVQLSGMSADERLMVQDARNARLVSEAFGRALGREVLVELEDAELAGPGASDEFTRDVQTLFDGRIEE